MVQISLHSTQGLIPAFVPLESIQFTTQFGLINPTQGITSVSVSQLQFFIANSQDHSQPLPDPNHLAQTSIPPIQPN